MGVKLVIILLRGELDEGSTTRYWKTNSDWTLHLSIIYDAIAKIEPLYTTRNPKSNPT